MVSMNGEQVLWWAGGMYLPCKSQEEVLTLPTCVALGKSLPLSTSVACISLGLLQL